MGTRTPSGRGRGRTSRGLIGTSSRLTQATPVTQSPGPHGLGAVRGRTRLDHLPARRGPWCRTSGGEASVSERRPHVRGPVGSSGGGAGFPSHPGRPRGRVTGRSGKGESPTSCFGVLTKEPRRESRGLSRLTAVDNPILEGVDRRGGGWGDVEHYTSKG